VGLLIRGPRSRVTASTKRLQLFGADNLVPIRGGAR
jgi:hypothetical protein